MSDEPFVASGSRTATIEKLRAKCTCANFSAFTVVRGQHDRSSRGEFRRRVKRRRGRREVARELIAFTFGYVFGYRDVKATVDLQ